MSQLVIIFELNASPEPAIKTEYIFPFQLFTMLEVYKLDPLAQSVGINLFVVL